MTFRLPGVHEVLLRAGFSPAEVEGRAREILAKKPLEQPGIGPSTDAPPTPAVMRQEDAALSRRMARRTVAQHIAQIRALLGDLPAETESAARDPSNTMVRREQVSSILNRMRKASEVLWSTEGICWVCSERGPRAATAELERLAERLLSRVPREQLSPSQRELLDDRVLFVLGRVRERERYAPSITPEKNTERSQEIWGWRREWGLLEEGAFMDAVLHEAWDRTAARSLLVSLGPHPFPARDGSSEPRRLAPPSRPVRIPLGTGADSSTRFSLGARRETKRRRVRSSEAPRMSPPSSSAWKRPSSAWRWILIRIACPVPARSSRRAT